MAFFGRNIARAVQRAAAPVSKALRSEPPADTSPPLAQPIEPPVSGGGGTRALGRGIMGAIKRATGRRFAGGGSVGSASKRADGCAQRGKTKGKII